MNSDQKSESSRSNSPQSKSQKFKEFPLDFFLQKDIISDEELRPLLNQAKEKFHIKSIHFTSTKQIPGLEGTTFTIEDDRNDKMNDKCEAANYIFQSIEERKKQNLTVILLIPEGIVSFLIGTGGTQISRIIDETKAVIAVNQPIVKFAPRTVKIQGESSKIFSAIKAITKKMQERGVTQEDYEKMPEVLDPQKISTKAKFIFSVFYIDLLMKLKRVEKNYNVTMKVKDGQDVKLKERLRRDEKIFELSGKLVDIQSAIFALLKKLQEQSKKQDYDYDVRIVMPASYASKLIGAKGCQIKELATKSKGAQIRVVSEKDTDPESDIIVQVGGTLQSKQDATVLILQQIECFKNGGPILESGKYLNEGFTTQYKNTIHIEDIKFRRQLSSSESDRYSRSRSSSKRKHKRRSYDRRSSHERRSPHRRSESQSNQKKSIFTTLIVQTKVIDYLEKAKKLREFERKFDIGIQVHDIRGQSESTVKLEGKIKNCLNVIEQILIEQSKILRK